MIIKISNLSEGEHYLNQVGKVEELRLTEPFKGNYDVSVKVAKTHHQIVLDTSISVVAHFECDRCAEEFDHQIAVKYQMVYLFGEDKEIRENDDANFAYLSIETDKIDITKDIHDFCLISIPLKKLCKEDCKGLCFKCGVNLNVGECSCTKEEVDARWQPLLDLKSKLNN
ncbi:MAG: DUF177 domain-containing protein [Ignavibacteria bacterium]|jgi:uncharacterized protein|nr:DUF177 domain-containing protein [Ignavibacteria bacterium]